MTQARTNSLREFATANGELVASAGNRPIRLDDSAIAWFVEHGALDVFLVEYQDDKLSSQAKHLLRAEAGHLVFGAGSSGALVTLAKGTPGSQLRRLHLDCLLQDNIGNELADQVDAWITAFAGTVASQIELRPRNSLLLDPSALSESQDAATGSVLSTRPGGVVWVDVGDSDAVYLGTEERDKAGSGLVPLTPDSWLTLQSPAQVTGTSTQELLDEGALLAALKEFHQLALGAENINRLLLLADEANEQTARTVHRHLDEERARQSLFRVLGSRYPTVADSGSPVLAALAVIGKEEGIDFRPPSRRRPFVGAEFSLPDILNASGIRSRRVRLSVEDRWWIGNSGPLLGYRREDGQPVALLPSVTGRYRVVDPVSGRSARLNAEQAATLHEDAWSFYRPLPADRSLDFKDIFRFATKGAANDFGQFAGAGLLASLFTLVPAVAIGLLADWVLPAGSGGMVVQITVALAVFAIVGTLLQILRGTAMMRLGGRASTRVGAALWDRLLGLPPSFFRNFTAGDLVVRMSAFQLLRDRMSGAVANALITLIFFLPMLGLLFVYDTTLAWLSIGLGLFSLAVTCVSGLLQIGPHRRLFAASRSLAGELLQFINGMSKLRSAGAEASAFAAWARGYREQQQAILQIGKLNDHLIAFGAAMPAFVGAALFGVTLWLGPDQLSLGNFLAVYAVSITFYGAIIVMGQSFETIATIIPSYEQVKPILEAVPENRQSDAAPAVLSGEVRFDQVSFQYSKDGPQIINDVYIHARPGEFIAIVGESGAGKSTLMRLALGLEKPSAGGIYYGGRDLAHLDRRSVRRQIGVVTQGGALKPGNLLDNIIGMGDELSIEDAWRAAKLAAVDREIEAMPMQMFTPVGDSASNFSGGQIQRIRIAAALVRDPRIVFLDEATSWLDAKSQAQVMEGIERLAATRIVIAHRLSTIRKAERIYVLHQGRIVQAGNFDELYDADGMFRTLVQRQMT